MNAQQDEAKRLRIRDVDLVDGFGRLDRIPEFGTPCLLAQTKKLSTYPASAQSFYACSPVTLLGQEVEGGSGSVTPASSTFFALNLGSAIPPVGSSIVATFVDSRWAFRFDG